MIKIYNDEQKNNIKNYKIYKHVFPNNKVYIGITKLKPKYRWGYNGNHYNHNILLFKAIKKYGWENVKHEILLENLTAEEANVQERKFITEIYHSNNRKYGYNIANGGNYKGFSTKETIKKMLKTRRETAKKNGYWNSPESRKKLSIAQKGHPYYENSRIANLKLKKEMGKKVMNIETGQKFDSIREAALSVKCSHIHISRCCRGIEKRCKGFHWKFVGNN